MRRAGEVSFSKPAYSLPLSIPFQRPDLEGSRPSLHECSLPLFRASILLLCLTGPDSSVPALSADFPQKEEKMRFESRLQET